MSRLNLRNHQPPGSRPGRQAGTLLTCCVLALSLGGCAFPRKDFSSVPDTNIIHVSQHNGQWRAEVPDCEPLLQPSQYNAIDNLRMSIAFGCATYGNLAASLARPYDLVRPPSFSGTHADTSRRAVERYLLNAVEPLRKTTSTSSTGN